MRCFPLDPAFENLNLMAENQHLSPKFDLVAVAGHDKVDRTRAIE